MVDVDHKVMDKTDLFHIFRGVHHGGVEEGRVGHRVIGWTVLLRLLI